MKPGRIIHASLVFLVACFWLPGCSSRVGPYPFRDPDLPLEKRLDDLLSRLTLDEKISQMVNTAPAISRLGIPEYDWWNECLHGVARAGVATVFPQAIGLAATWDADLLYRVASAISDEARAKHHEFLRHGLRGRYQGLTFWSPNINIFRDPRWGRGMETYGEDPYLTGTLAVAFIRGLQGEDPRYLKVVATPKHFAVHSGPEPERHRFDASVTPWELWDTYLPAFERSIRIGRAFSVMCAYNRLEGEACCANHYLLTEILRKKWGFAGYVVSDCGAIYDIWQFHKLVESPPEAAAMAVRAGTDLNCGNQFLQLREAVRLGFLREAEIDTAVRRLFRARFRLGMFDPPERVPYAHIPFSVVASPKHAELALEAAKKSIVLLKNGGLLPLRETFRRVAVIGPNGNSEEVLLANYHGLPVDPWTVYRGLRVRLKGKATVRFSPGCNLAPGVPAMEVIPSAALRSGLGPDAARGLRAEYYANPGWRGVPKATRVDSIIDFNWKLVEPPGRDTRRKTFSVRWTGLLIPPVSGLFYLGGYGLREFRIYLEDTLFVKARGEHNPRMAYRKVRLEKGRVYRIRVDYVSVAPETQLRPSFQLLWGRPEKVLRQEALRLALWADLIVLTLGLSPRLEGEQLGVQVPGFYGGDRTDLRLPEPQRRLMHEVASLEKPVVLVLLNGSALAIKWAARHIPAILEAWYPGQAGGKAIAQVLFGDHNPAGRLPVTFYQSISQLPPFDDYSMKNRTYRYFTGTPLFPFGYGLSYTRFRYGDLRMPEQIRAGDTLRIAVTVQNVGGRAGEEVVQLYVQFTHPSRTVPRLSLQGYRRIFLNPGERRIVRFTLLPEQLTFVGEDGERLFPDRPVVISVGGKPPGYKGVADAPTTGVVVRRLRISAPP